MDRVKAFTNAQLLERDAHLSAIERFIGDVEAGSGHLALIEGEAGIGKTSLLAAACARATDRGFTVLSARGGERERDFAFGIVRQLFESLLWAAQPAERDQLLEGAARFAGVVFDAQGEEVERSVDPSHGVLHGLYWLVANVAERGPTMIAIDDAHWADQPSLRFASFIARRLEDMGVLLVLASRSGEPGAEADSLRALCQELGTRPIELRRLSEDAVASLVRAHLSTADGDELCAACHEATGGNPFLLSELLITLDDQPDGGVDAATVMRLAPRGVAASVLARLARLPESASALAQAVAVLGDRAPLVHAAALAQIAPTDAGAIADLLAEASILERERPLRFVHPIVRSTIYDGLPLAHRAQAHGAAARLLATAAAGPDAVALQLLETEQRGDEWVVQSLREAASSALDRGAPEVAARYLRRALIEPPQQLGEVLVELGSAETRAGDAAASDRLAAARELATEPWCQARAAMELAQVLSYQGRSAEAAQIALQTLGAMRDRPDVAVMMKVLLLVFSQADRAARDQTRELLDKAAALVERRGPAAPRSTLAIIALECAMVGGTAQEAAALGEWAVADDGMAEQAVWAFAEGRLLKEAETPHPFIAATALTLADRGEVAERELSVALDDARRRGSARGFGHVSAFRAWSRGRRGALAGAEADARASLQIADDQRLFRPLALSALVDVLVEAGDLRGAAAALADDGEAANADDMLPAQPLRESRARLSMAEHQPAAALAALRGCARWEEGWGASNGIWVQWRSAAALAHLALGDADEARRLVGEEELLTRRFGAKRAIGITLSAAGVVDGGPRGIELLGEAVALLEPSDARLEHARALVRLGSVMRRQGQRRDAREPLRSGLDLAARLGGGALAETARQELLAAGGRPRRPVLTGNDALTPSERRVAEAAATGLTNREIAQSLFLTVRTIEMHLTNTYHKLGVASRDQLAPTLHS